MMARTITSCNTIPEINSAFRFMDGDDCPAYIYKLMLERLKTITKGTDHRPGLLAKMIEIRIKQKEEWPEDVDIATRI